MNKALYKVIFNKKRGCMMVVAENTKSEGKSVADTQDTHRSLAPIPASFVQSFSILSFSVSIILGTASIAFADGIVADRDAPKNRQATVLQSANGTPQVNIQTPTQAGVSVNQFSQFDVGQRGAILNNSRINTQTQLGGWIQGNPWLATGEARVIVNQVNATHPSLLNGYIEVGGRCAEVVIANPAGIQLSGGGLINVSRATLTTGMPQYQAGALTGFQVRSGNVAIGSQGLDARDTDYTRILSQTAQINAPVWGKDIRVVTGQNNVAATGDSHTPSAVSSAGNTASNTNHVPLFAIGTGTLGGMYANKITLISTNPNAAIRNQGQLFASAGNVAIDANGNLVNSGTIAATNTQDTNNTHEHRVTIRSKALDNSGTIAAQQHGQIDSQSIRNSGILLSSGQWVVTNANTLTNETSGQIQAARLAIQTTHLDNGGNITQTGSQKLSIETQGKLENRRRIGLPDTTPAASNGSGSNTTTPTIPLSGVTTAPSTAAGLGSAAVSTATPTTATTYADGFIQTRGALTNSGSIIANGQTSIVAQQGVHNAGQIDVHQLDVKGAELTNQNGTLITDNTHIQTDRLNNQNGNITTRQQLAIATAQLDNTKGKLLSAGTANLVVLGSLNNTQQGDIQATGLTIDAGTLNNDGSILQTGSQKLTIEANGLLTNNGRIGIAESGSSTNLFSTATASTNSNSAANTGSATQPRNVAHNANTTHVTNTTSNPVSTLNDGYIQARGALNNSGSIIANGQTDVIAHQGLDNSQQIAINQLTVNGSHLANQASGSIHATQIKAEVQQLNNAGQLIANQTFINSQTLDNTGHLASITDLSITNSGQIHNATIGQIQANHLSIDTAQLNNAGVISQTGGQNWAIKVDGLMTNSGKIGVPDSANAAQQPAQPTTHLVNHPITSGNQTTVNGIVPAANTTTQSTTPQKPQTGRIHAHDNLTNSGSLLANGETQLVAHQGLDNTGYVDVQQLNVTGTALNNNHAHIRATEATIQTQQVNNQQGELATDKQLTIQTQQINNQQGQILSVGNANLHVSGSLNNSQQGQIAANQTLRINDDNHNTLAIDNTDGIIQSSDTVAIESRSLTNNGIVSAGNHADIQLQDSFTVERDMSAGNSFRLATAGTLTNAHILKAGQSVTLQGYDIVNQAGASVQAGQMVQAIAQHDLINRGVWNSNGLTHLEVRNSLLNIGTGKIYGNHVALAADNLTNKEETIGTNTKAAVVAARERLDIGARNINNQEAAILSSEGDLAIGGSLDAHQQVTGIADSLIDASARIEAQGNGKIAVKELQNVNNHFKVEEYLAERTGQIRDYAVAKENTYYQSGKDGYFDNSSGKKDQTIATFHLNNGQRIDANQWHVRDYHKETYKEKVVESKPAQIIIGGRLAASGQNWINKDSQMIVGGDLITDDLENGQIINDATLGKGQVESIGMQWDSVTKKKWYKRKRRPRRIEVNYDRYYETENFTHEFDTPISIVQQNTNVEVNQQTAAILNNSSTTVTPTQGHSKTAGNISNNTNLNNNIHPTVGNIVSLNNRAIQLPTNSLYTINPNSQSWLVETDPAFTNYRQWLGSDYMLGVLQNDPNNIHKRLGDGYYEQKLVNEQINRLTGFRRLDGYSNDEAQFKALMDSGITASQELGLTLGISLTPDQVSRLTSDIVWLETQTVTLADGSTQTVLIPKVYVLARKGDVNTSGSLISANQINLNLHEGTLTNIGTIAGRQVVVLNARDINNSGQLQADKIGLTASNNINFNGGTAKAGNALIANANNINLNTTTSSADDKQNGTTVVDRVAALYVSGNAEGNGILALNAQNDLNLNAAAIGNDAKNGVTQLSAGHNLNLGTVTTEDHETFGALNDRNHRHVHQTEEVGSHIQTQGNAMLHAGNDMNIRQGTINSQNGQVALEAGQDINVTEGRKTLDMDVSIYTKSNNVISSTKTLDQYQGHHDEALGSTITGKTIVINAGNDALIQGSNIVSDGRTSLSASKDIAIVVAQNHYTDNSYHQVKKSGLMGIGGLGFSIGSKKTTDDTDQTSLIHTGSTVGSLKGNTTIIAGNHYTQKGSTVSSPDGNNLIAAKNIDIEAAQNRYATGSKQTFEQKGLTVALNVPVVNATQSAVQATKNINASKNDRVNAMAAANAAWQGYQLTKENGAFDNASTAVSQALNGNAKQAAETSGISITLTYGEQKSRNEAHSRVTQAQASQTIAGGKTTLIATGNGEQSNINIQGSDVAGQAGTILIADNNIKLQSAKQHISERNDKRSTGWNAGVKAGYENGSLAFGLTAGANVGKGYSNSDSITHRHSHIGDHNSQTTVQSKGDTTIKGAQVLGKGIKLNSQNLTIESPQDTETHRSKQHHASAQVILGYGASGTANYNHSKINADHASVTEQSGIFAGDDGYQVNVKEHTDLKGGIITSTQSAEDNGNNQFSTGTLAASDIHNHSHYDGQSIGLGISGSVSGEALGQGKSNNSQESHLSTVADKNSLSKTLGYGSDNGSQESVTRSGINTRNIQITDESKQQQQTGKSAAETIAQIHTNTTTETATEHSGRLKNSFDQDKVQRELDVQREVTQEFSKNVQEANTEINQHLDSLKDKLEKGQISQTDYDKEIANWQKGSVVLNMLASGVSAPTQSIAGIAAATASPALSYQIGQYFKDLAQNNSDGQLTAKQETAHIVAHSILGAAVSATGGNNALVGAISAGGAEAAAPIISQWLYGERDGNKLDAEQKQTINTITSLIGTGTGAVIGNTTADAVAGNLNADSAVGSNYLTFRQTLFKGYRIKLCLFSKDPECERKIIQKFDALSLKQDLALDTDCKRNSNSKSCNQKMEDALKYVGRRNSYIEQSDINQSRKRVLEIANTSAYSTINNLGRRADYFGAMYAYTHQPWFRVAEEVSRGYLSLANATGFSDWVEEAGAVVMKNAHNDFYDIYKNYPRYSYDWSERRLYNEQSDSELQRVHEEHYQSWYVWGGRWFANQKAYGNFLDYRNRIKVGCSQMPEVDACKRWR